MPSAVTEVFEPLRNELIRIHERWALYRLVFGQSEERVDLLKRINEIFFGHTQWSMYLDVILALCRYTDPQGEVTKKGEDRRNCTLECLVETVKDDDNTFGGALEANEWAAVENCRDNDFEDIRSKRIAHNDFTKVTARSNGQPVGWPSREQVMEFLKLCTDLMDAVQQHYLGRPLAFDAGAHDAKRSADNLFKVLTEYAEFHDDQVRSGKRGWSIRPPKDWPVLATHGE